MRNTRVEHWHYIFTCQCQLSYATPLCQLTYSAGSDTEGEDISDAGDGDGDPRLFHGQAHPLRYGPLRHSGVLVEVVPAGHDDEHVIYPDPFVRVKG